jgi:hypothetical protein
MLPVMAAELDPRWDWIDISTYGEGPGTTFIKGACNHLEVEPVTDVDGDLVAHLCRTCDTQLPAEMFKAG